MLLRQIGAPEYKSSDKRLNGCICAVQQLKNSTTVSIYYIPSVECPVGKYKATVGNTECLPCPENSEATEAGSTSCRCLPGFYRGTDESPDVSCAGECAGPSLDTMGKWLQVDFLLDSFQSADSLFIRY